MKKMCETEIERLNQVVTELRFSGCLPHGYRSYVADYANVSEKTVWSIIKGDKKAESSIPTIKKVLEGLAQYSSKHYQSSSESHQKLSAILKQTTI